MIHYCDSMSDWEAIRHNGILDYAAALKKQRRIHHIGLSSHNPQVALAAVRTGLIEVLMFSVNPCYDTQMKTSMNYGTKKNTNTHWSIWIRSARNYMRHARHLVSALP